jgi:hypothetical protein
VVLDGTVDQCEVEIKNRWMSRLSAVDIWSRSHCQTALIYARWDDPRH